MITCFDVIRSWIINPGAVTHLWLIPLAAVPAVLGTILIFLDQQITAVIINRKEHKLVVSKTGVAIEV
jgi:hypothetical protein